MPYLVSRYAAPGIPSRNSGYANYEVMVMEQKEQNAAKEFEAKAKAAENFNPHWNEGEFLGPNTFRHEKDMQKYGEEES